MLDSILIYLGEIFLDTVIDRSFDTKVSKKKKIFYTFLFTVILLFYISLFGFLFYIAVDVIQEDKMTAIKLFVTCLLLLIVFLVYGHRVISHWKNSRK